jgi:hypothetical protein
MQMMVDAESSIPWILQKSFISEQYPEKEQHVCIPNIMIRHVLVTVN